MKKLLYVSDTHKKMHKKLVLLRDKQFSLRLKGIKTVVFTKTHEKQLQTIERMDNYLNPNRKLTVTA